VGLKNHSLSRHFRTRQTTIGILANLVPRDRTAGLRRRRLSRRLVFAAGEHPRQHLSARSMEGRILNGNGTKSSHIWMKSVGGESRESVALSSTHDTAGRRLVSSSSLSLWSIQAQVLALVAERHCRARCWSASWRFSGGPPISFCESGHNLHFQSSVFFLFMFNQLASISAFLSLDGSQTIFYSF